MFKKLIVPAFVGLALAPAIASSATLKELEDRITQLEDEAVVATEGVYELTTRDEGRMKISGYSDVEYHTSTKDGSVDGFRLHHMSLFFEKDLGSKWHFFSEIEYEDAPKFEGEGEPQPVASGAEGEIIDDAQGKIFVEAVNLTYKWRQEANFRIGRMFTPGGIWNVDHYPTFVPTQERPQHIRKMFPQIMDGAQVFGTTSLGAAFANYDIYYVNGTGNTAKHDHNQAKATGAKLSLIFPVLNHFELGASVYNDPEDTAKNDEEYSATGIHGKIRAGSVTLQFEQAASAWDVDEREGYYAQLLYDWEKFTFGVRNDYYDEDADDSATESGKTQNSLFVNYHVNKAVTLKAEYHAVDHEDDATKDYGKTVFSVVGYLGN
jgi:hypothetical protein